MVKALCFNYWHILFVVKIRIADLVFRKKFKNNNLFCMDFHNVETLGNGGGNMKDKLNKLMEKNGFIIMLFIIVCLIAGGTLYLSMKSLNRDLNMGRDDFVILDDTPGTGAYTEDENSGLEETLSAEEEFEEVGEEKEEDLEITQEEFEEVVKTSSEDEEEVIETSSSDVEELEFEDDIDELEEVDDINLVSTSSGTIILPIEGPIITEYTSDVLVYSETLEAWVGHAGIDIGAEVGTPVKAAADGTVKEVYEDELWGIVIVIDHGNQLETKYANLLTKEMVKEGTKVKQGDHISKVGSTAKIEMLMEPHLHFEVRKNGNLVDPRSITR